MPKSAGYVSPEYLKLVAQAVRPFKDKTYELMNLGEGCIVLDMGCGPAIDTIEMAKYVGDSGKVYGIDMDEEMIKIANDDALASPYKDRVQHQTGTLEALPFADNFFDACRAERLFQVIPLTVDRQVLFSEIYRVLKPGGRLVLSDTDWGSASVDYEEAELERKLMNFFAISLRPDGFAGRKLKGQFQEHNFQDISVYNEVFPMSKLEETPFGDWLTEEAVIQKIVDREQADKWLKKLTERSENKTFYAAVNTITVRGIKPYSLQEMKTSLPS